MAGSSFYWPSIHDELNAQQNIVTKGLLNTYVVADKPEYFNKIADNLQELYSSAMESGDNISYRPFMVVRDKQGISLPNSDKLHVPSSNCF
ncbi:hypothetical protein J4731_19150 [Providencia rettgeri]|nr:hypothetical protein [Providencia rettgeri]